MDSKPINREQLDVFDRLLSRLDVALDQARSDVANVVRTGAGLLPSARIENLDLEEMSLLKMLLKRDSGKMRAFLEGKNEMPDFDTRWFQTHAEGMQPIQETEQEEAIS